MHTKLEFEGTQMKDYEKKGFNLQQQNGSNRNDPRGGNDRGSGQKFSK